MKSSRPWYLAMALAMTSLAAGSAAQEEDAPPLLGGLVGEYRVGATGVRRIDEAIAFDWGTESPDERLPAGPFSATWTGQLFVRRDGPHRLYARTAGRIRVTIGGRTVLEGTNGTTSWLEAETELAAGHVPIGIEYERTGPSGSLGLYWSSRYFGLEPIPARDLVHEPAASPGDSYRRGAALVDAYRCAACHDLPGGTHLAAPSLRRLRGTVHRDWLVDYLLDPTKAKRHARMPALGLHEAEARAIADHLLGAGEEVRLDAAPKGNARRGSELAQRIGCLACHTIGERGAAGIYSGGDLSRIAEKRPVEFFPRWLRDPASLNRHHRMPIFELSGPEVADLAAFLGTLKGPPLVRETRSSARRPGTGASELIRTHRCAQCHEIEGAAADQRVPLRRFDSRRPGCLAEADPQTGRPGYRFSEPERAAIRAFLSAARRSRPQTSGRTVLERNNCLACHERNHDPGLRTIVGQLGIRDPKEQAALVPPSLNSVGDKLADGWLADAVAGRARRLRPWLAPRMPRFRHPPDEAAALAAYLVEQDRIPADAPRAAPAGKTPPREELLLGAHRLVGSSGFGCLSCHAVGSYEPPRVELGARGSDLRFLDRRLRWPWYVRWMRNPARIQPGVEMPAVTTPAPGVLDAQIETQLLALWEGLNAPRFDLPSAPPVQVLATDPRRPIILRDVFEHGPDDYTCRSLAVGLPNGHNLLLDLDSLSLRRWWIGDLARQKTRGKSWFWETGGPVIGDWPGAPPLVRLAGEHGLAREGSRVGRLQWYEETARGVRLAYQCSLRERGNGSLQLNLEAEQGGWRLEVTAPSASPSSWELVLPMERTGERELACASAIGRGRVLAATAGRFSVASAQAMLPFETSARGPTAAVRFQFGRTLPASPSSVPAIPVAARQLVGPPGYEAVRLPLPDGPMPTAMAFRPDGTLVVGSLKGEVYLVRDNEYRLFAGPLAAPYGVLADGDDVLVAHKAELLRLKDRDRDGRAERFEVVASGWGLTADYHDWTVGIARGPDGSLFVSPCCQQDDRSLAAARWRGKVLRIGTAGAVEEFAAGIRFAMGLAINADGELFATDNQGVTNPFNELNHIRRGRHYGFWNKLEPRAPNQVVTPPAIQIPHPWSRSVNGIAFIPSEGFGPFSGQLLGADYTTRKLIRMSLERVGETYQGAAYPFGEADEEALRNDRALLGPVSLAFAPDGSLLVGSMTDSGWGGGNNRGAIERVRYVGPVPLGIHTVRARSDGFEIEFTRPVPDRLRLAPTHFRLSCYRRIPQGGYETPDQDRTPVRVEAADLSPDRRRVRLRVRPMRPGFVYDLAIDGAGESLYPAVAFYTLHTIPASR